jgi:hypothetical protein
VLATDTPSMPIDFPDPWAYVEFMKHAADQEIQTARHPETR